jgi:hypothetical protein
MVITRSVKLQSSTYLAPAGDSAVVTIRGSKITVDMRGVALIGSADRSHGAGRAGAQGVADGEPDR